MKKSYAQFLKVLLSEAYVNPAQGRRMHREAPAEEGDYIIVPGVGGRQTGSQTTNTSKEKDEKKKAEKEAEKEAEKAAKDAEKKAAKERSDLQKYVDALKRTGEGGGKTYGKIITDPLIAKMNQFAAGSSGRRSGPVI